MSTNRCHNIKVYHPQGDGDTLVIKTAIELAKSVSTPVVVVAQDTDILILLVYHRPVSCTNLLLLSDMDGLYHISSLRISDPNYLLFKYAWSGSDTVSSICGHTKEAIYKCDFPKHIINIFLNTYSSHDEIKHAGVKAMQVTYACGDTPLEKARFLKFQKQVVKGKIDADRLPPTEDAATQHALRVHLQIAVWHISQHLYSYA